MHRETVEEAPFSFLLQDKQHTQPQSRRATEAPASDDGPGRREIRTEDSDRGRTELVAQAADSDRGRGRAGGSAPWTGAAQGAGRGAGLVARRALNSLRGRERMGKEITPALAKAQ